MNADLEAIAFDRRVGFNMDPVSLDGTWVTIKDGPWGGQSGQITRQRGAGAYVTVPGVGSVLVHLDDVLFRSQRRAAR